MCCPLIREFKRQFQFGDYLSTNQRRCRVLHRIDEVAKHSCWNIDVPSHRLNILAEVKPAYDLFAAYIDERLPHTKAVGRHGTCLATLEWHGLHQYLAVNGVDTDSVSRYIAADKFDRQIFHASRMSGEFLYFSKHPRSLDESLYAASKAPRYAMDEGIHYSSCPLDDFESILDQCNGKGAKSTTSAVNNIGTQAAAARTVSIQTPSVPMEGIQTAAAPMVSIQPASVPIMEGIQPAAAPMMSIQPPSVPMEGIQPASVPMEGIQPAAAPMVSIQPPSVPMEGIQSAAATVASTQPPAATVVSIQPTAEPTAPMVSINPRIHSASPSTTNDTPNNEAQDPLIALIRSQMFFGDYASDPVQENLRALERIDMIAHALKTPVDEPEDRITLAERLKPLYDQFHAYLLNERPDVYEVHRNGVIPASLEWHALHLFLMENGFSAEAVAEFIQDDVRDRKKFEHKRLSGQYIYYSKCPIKLDKSKYPMSVKRYNFKP
jgi:hypothetical protein